MIWNLRPAWETISKEKKRNKEGRKGKRRKEEGKGKRERGREERERERKEGRRGGRKEDLSIQLTKHVQGLYAEYYNFL
jgi:hypothetical protein